MTTRLADGNIGNDDGVKLANRIPPLLNWITSDNTDKYMQYIHLHLNVREYRKGNAKMDNPEKYKQYINLHIFPSTLKDHSLSQKMNDDINIDSIITLSRKQVFNGLLVKKGTSVGLWGQNKSQLIKDLIPIQTLKKLLIFIEDQNEYIIFNIFNYKNSAPEFTPGFKWGSCYSIFSFIFMFFRSLFVLLSFFICSLCCMFFLDLRILITPLVSSNSS